MFRNYLKIGWRNLTKNKSYTFINILGLSLGIACCILIFTLLHYHLSFDNFHSKRNRIYRIVTEWHDEETGYSQGVPSPLGKAFRDEFTVAEKTARVIDYNGALVSVEQGQQRKKFKEDKGVVYAEQDFFDIMDFPLLKGDPKHFLTEPNTAAITQNLAVKYFGTDDVLGKVIKVNNKRDFIITGILKNIPANTVRKQEIYLSYKNLADQNKWLARDSGWGGVYSGSQCYTLLKKGATVAQANRSLAQIIKKNYDARDQKSWVFRLQPLADVHFNTDFDGEADKKYLWTLGLIGLFLIVTACVNFINLATAQAMNRSKEVGIRKVMGCMPRQVFWQFIVETAVLTFFSVILAVSIAAVSLPYVNSLFHTEMRLHVFDNTDLLTFLLCTGTIVTFLSGSYPGLILARFKPVLAIKSKLAQKNIGGISLRRVLVVTQFAISQTLIIATIVVASQMRYSENTDMGFTRKAIITMSLPENDITKLNTLKTRLAGVAGVEKLSMCFQPPASSSNNTTDITYDTRSEPEHWGINEKFADADYLSTFGIKLAAGRNFFPSDTAREVLVNETFVRKLNLQSPDQVIGKTLEMDGKKGLVIVGVVKDFHNYSFHSDIAPVALFPSARNYSTCAVKVSLGQLKPAMKAFEKIWNDTYPDYLFEAHFLDEQIARFYEDEMIMLKLIEGFAAIAILIGSLGLYGLVSFMAVRRTREIGVRKVLGASISHVLWLFGKEFTRLLLFAFVIAAPLGWWAMHHYLQEYKSRITLHPGFFVLALLITFLIAAMGVGYRSFRAAVANPVKALRTE